MTTKQLAVALIAIGLVALSWLFLNGLVPSQSAFNQPVQTPPPQIGKPQQNGGVLVKAESQMVGAVGISAPESGFNYSLASELLRQIPLDDQGDPIVNNELKRQLDQAVSLIGPERTAAELELINQLIHTTFAPDTAKAVEYILDRYYAYKVAELAYIAALSESTSLDAAENYNRLAAMRDSYLGHQLSEQLFAEENNYSDYIRELTEKLSVPDLTDEMRRSITVELQQKYRQSSPAPEELQ